MLENVTIIGAATGRSFLTTGTTLRKGSIRNTSISTTVNIAYRRVIQGDAPNIPTELLGEPLLPGQMFLLDESWAGYEFYGYAASDVGLRITTNDQESVAT